MVTELLFTRKFSQKTDKSPPIATFCPSDIFLTSSKPMSIEWKEPVFEDDQGILNIVSNYHSGDIFVWWAVALKFINRQINFQGRTPYRLHCNRFLQQHGQMWIRHLPCAQYLHTPFKSFPRKSVSFGKPTVYYKSISGSTRTRSTMNQEVTQRLQCNVKIFDFRWTDQCSTFAITWFFSVFCYNWQVIVRANGAAPTTRQPSHFHRVEKLTCPSRLYASFYIFYF